MVDWDKFKKESIDPMKQAHDQAMDKIAQQAADAQRQEAERRQNIAEAKIKAEALASKISNDVLSKHVVPLLSGALGQFVQGARAQGDPLAGVEWRNDAEGEYIEITFSWNESELDELKLWSEVKTKIRRHTPDHLEIHTANANMEKIELWCAQFARRAIDHTLAAREGRDTF